MRFSSLIPAFLAFVVVPASLNGATLRHHYLLDADGHDALGVADLSVQGDSVNFHATGSPGGGYVTLGGSDDYLVATLGTGSKLSILGDYITFRPFSVSFWVRQAAAQAPSGTQAVFGMTTESSDSSTFNTGFETATRESSLGLGLLVRERQGGGGSDSGQIATGYNISDGNWHHVVVVYDATTRSAYVDGFFRGGSNVQVGITTNPVSRFAIGALLRASGILDDFAGDIGDFQIYDGALTTLEAVQLYEHPGATLVDQPVDVASNPADVVDTLIGVLDAGSCVPGPCLPNSSIYPSPDTLTPNPGGYTRNSPVVGFAQLHPQGSGSSTMSYGNFLVSPQAGPGSTEANHASPVSAIAARPYSFRAHLDKWNTDCTTVAAANSAIYEFSFPAGSDERLYFDVSRKQNSVTGMTSGSVTIDPAAGAISGGGAFDGNWNPAPYNVYFYAMVDATPSAVGTFTGNTETPGKTSASVSTRQRLGGWMQFDTTGDHTIRMKIAVSFVSVDQAKAHLLREIPGWDLEGLEATAKAAWNDKLSVLQTPGIAPDEARKLYTSLFHSLTQPRDRTLDAAGRPGWPAGTPFWDDYYTLWDTWQTLYPLLTIVHPEIVAANVNAFATRYAVNGVAETAFIQGKDFQVGQGGDEADSIIGDAFVKQVPGIDWDKVWPLLQFNSSRRTDDYRNLGFVSSDGSHGGYDSRMASGSSTLAFAFEDWCTSRVAQGLGHTDVAAQLLARSENWKNVWDASLTGDGFSGFIRAKSRAGNFSTNPATATNDFYQGTPWNYSFNVHHQPDEMIGLMGGHARFVQRMEFAYGKNNSSYIDFTNEPCFQTLWLFSHASRPYLTSFWADQLRQRYGTYSFTGDEDSGAMSSLYFFLTAGFCPVAGQDIYYLHGSRVPELDFHLANGSTFKVTAANSGGANIYVQSAMLNGQPLTSPVIHHSDIMAGSTLAFVMGPKPSDWGTSTDFAAPATRELVMPVSGPWTSAAAEAGITAGDTAAPGWTASAAASAIDSAFTPVTLGQGGDSVILSAKVNFSGFAASTAVPSSRFAWGLFSSNAQAGVTGWPGYLAANDTAAPGIQNLWKKTAGSASAFYSTGGGAALASYALAPSDFANGDYRLVMSLTRTATAGLDYEAALVRSADGVLVAAFTGSDATPATFTFDHAGFRAGTDLGAGTVTLSGCTVTAGRTSYDGRPLVIPEGAAFYWDGGVLTAASISNLGSLTLSGGAVTVAGDLSNAGSVFLKGAANLTVGGALNNQGTLDKITSTGTLQATVTGDGVTLDLGSVKQSLSVNGAALSFTLHATQGHVYQLQKDSSGTLAGPWVNVGDPVSGTGSDVTIDTSATDGEVAGFYRVAVDP
jgi:predicted alpha-1,2-mannosidase